MRLILARTQRIAQYAFALHFLSSAPNQWHITNKTYEQIRLNFGIRKLIIQFEFVDAQQLKRPLFTKITLIPVTRQWLGEYIRFANISSSTSNDVNESAYIEVS